jgi:hypothetical protein
MLYTLGVLALTLAGTVLVLTFVRWSGENSKHEETEDCPHAIEKLTDPLGHNSSSFGCPTSPLVVQAEAFSRHLNPPRIAEKPSAPTRTLPRYARNDMVSSAPPAPPVRPAAPSVKFKLVGTSYYPNQPGKGFWGQP